jgi:D-alanine transaminase
MTVCYLNGAFIEQSSAVVSVNDRGFLFGDGVYEVIRASGGRMFAADRHLKRLARGLADLELPRPRDLDDAALLAVAQRLLDENRLTRGAALIYFQITRGAAPRTHQFPPPGTAPTVYVAANAFTPPDDLRARGAAVVTTPDVRWGRCDLKTLQILPNALAKEQATRAGAFEGVFVRDGLLIEGASTNLFAVVGNTLRTHPADHHILPGITREIVLELAGELGIGTREQALKQGEVAAAAEFFLTSTSADVMPVVTLDGRNVGGGRPGPVARRLHEALHELAAQAGQPAVR